jgi:hypothetical protein
MIPRAAPRYCFVGILPIRLGSLSRLVYHLKAQPSKLAVGLLATAKISNIQSARHTEDVLAGVQSTSVSKCVLVRPLVQPSIVVIGVAVSGVEMPQRIEHLILAIGRPSNVTESMLTRPPLSQLWSGIPDLLTGISAQPIL